MSTRKPELKSLQDEWYKKLEESGFHDIESPSGLLRSRTVPHNMETKTEIEQDAIFEYYSMCTAFLWNHKFEKPLDRIIWEYYSNGLTCVEIADTLNKTGLYKTSKSAVHRVTQKLEQQMKDKYLK